MSENKALSRIAIVGGGITGLATAYFLQAQARAQQRPLEVYLIEAGPRLGGKVLTEREDGFLVEGGPDAFLTTKPWALRLCQELGLADQVVGPQPQNHKTFVLGGGRLRRLPEGVMGLVPTRFGPFLRSDLFSPWGKLRMGLDLLVPPRRDGGDESLGHFVRRRLGREALERLAEPLLAGIYAADADQLSLLATFPRFREMERRHRSLIAGTLAVRRRRPPASAPPKAPVSRSPFRTLRSGLSELVKALQARLRETPDVSVILGQRVVEVQRRNTAPAYRLRLAEGRAIEADAVVLAVPAYAAAEMVASLSPQAAELLSDIAYASTAVVTLALRREQVAHPLDGTGFVVSRTEGRALTACTWSASKWPGRAPEGFVLLRCFFGRAGQEGVLAQDDEALSRLAWEELRDLLGLEGRAVRVWVHRWPRAMPQYRVGHLERLQELDEVLGEHPGLILAGAAYRGIGLPDCIRQAQEAAGRVLGAEV